MIRSRGVCALLALLAMSCAQDSAAQTLSQSEFRDAVAVEIARQHSGLCIEKADIATIHVGRSREACKEAVLSTTYIYEQYASDPDHLQKYVGVLAAMISSAIQKWEGTSFRPNRAHIVISVRPSAYVKDAKADPKGENPIWKPFVGDLVALVMQKDGELSRSISAADLKGIGLTESAAWELAERNTRLQIGRLDRSPNSQGAEVVTASSGLATSTLLLAGTCRKGGANFDAFVVARDTYFYADQKSQEATSMLAGYAAQLLQSGQNTYSQNLISCIEGRWYASAFDGHNTWRPVSTRDR